MPVRLNRIALLIFAALLPLPVYFVQTPDGFVPAVLGLFNDFRPGIGVPVAAAGLAFVILAWGVSLLSRGDRPRLGAVGWLALAYLLWLGVSCLYGLTISQTPVLTILFAGQAALPVALLITLLTIPVQRQTLRSIQVVTVIASAVTVPLIIAAAIYFMSAYPLAIGWDYLATAIYSQKNIHSAIIAANMAILLAQLTARDPVFSSRWTSVLLAVHAIYLVVNWSRTGLAMIVIVTVLWAGAAAIRKNYRRALMALTIVGILFVADQTVGGSHLRYEASQMGSGEYAPKIENDDRSRREILFVEGGRRVLARPVFGDAFVPLLKGSEVVGRTATSATMFPSHNQYIDLAIRSGLPAVFLFLAMSLALVRSLWLAFRGNAGSLGGELALSGIALFAAYAVGAMFQDFFVVTQPAAMLFTVLALAIRLAPFDQADSAAEVDPALLRAAGKVAQDAEQGQGLRVVTQNPGVCARLG